MLWEVLMDGETNHAQAEGSDDRSVNLTAGQNT